MSPQINWDGKILGCSVNKWNALGNVNDEDIQAWQNSEKFHQLITVLFEGEPCSEDLPCYYCPNYISKKGIPLTDRGLQAYLNYVPLALKQKFV